MHLRKGVIAAAAIGVLLLFRGYWMWTEVFYRRHLIPSKLGTGWFYTDGDCGSVFSAQGAFVFGLDGKTIVELNKHGLHFFDDITMPQNQATQQYFSGDWKETPLPDLGPNGLLSMMYCGMQYSWMWPAGIPEALGKPGGFYQTSGARTLIVLPNEGYLVGVVADR